MTLPLSGIVPPLITPLTATGGLDEPALARLIARQADAGATALFLLGTTGEGPFLGEALKAEIIRAACAAARLPILAGLCSPADDDNLRLAVTSARTGAAALVLTPPYYLAMTQEELADWLERMVPRLPLPVYLYHIPALTRTGFAVETVVAAARLPNVAGLKDSGGDLGYLRAVRAALPASTGFSLLCGPEEMLFEALEAGADGGVTGGANLAPELYCGLYRAYRQGDFEAARRAQEVICELSRNVYSLTSDPSSYLRGIKTAHAALGLCGGTFAAPFAPLGDAECARIRDFFAARALGQAQ
jgi:4-hydroxy-tetrahydrodipicolinate synthase